MQVLYERGFIDKGKLNEYSKNGKKRHKDNDGNIMDKYKQYVLTHLMQNCDDFKNQKNAVEELCEELSHIGDPSITILTSPKYHCEIAGEGIELNWGYSKKCYRNIPYHEKNTKVKFVTNVTECIGRVNIDLVKKFAAKTRRYMLTYQNVKGENLTYESIEKFVKKINTHRNIADSEKGYLEKIWRDSMGLT